MKKALFKKYFPRGYALTSDRKKVWLCKNKHLFEKKSKKVIGKICPECGELSYQPTELGFKSGILI